MPASSYTTSDLDQKMAKLTTKIELLKIIRKGGKDVKKLVQTLKKFVLDCEATPTCSFTFGCPCDNQECNFRINNSLMSDLSSELNLFTENF